MVGILGTVFATLAAVLHVWIFVLESVQWRRPTVWRRFGVRDQDSADTLAPMAFNQGFYNLFLALGTFGGLAMFWVGGEPLQLAGRVLVLFALGSMAAASLVLASGGRRYRGAAVVQGTLPLIGILFWLFA